MPYRHSILPKKIVSCLRSGLRRAVEPFPISMFPFLTHIVYSNPDRRNMSYISKALGGRGLLNVLETRPHPWVERRIDL